MPSIVLIHGAGNALWGPTSINARWYPAVADGLHWHGVAIEPGDVRVAFYGDLFRDDPESGYVAPVDPKQAIASLSKVVAAADPHVDLDELVKTLTEQHVDRLVAQAAAYFDREEVRSTAQARVAAAIDDDTRVVVAHSLGSVVAYETLCGLADGPVTDFVTLGSPLAGPQIRPRLVPAPTDGHGVAPPGIRSWTNVMADGDPACTAPLAPVFGERVTDRRVDNGHRVHDPEPYLNNATTGRAIADALARPRR